MLNHIPLIGVPFNQYAWLGIHDKNSDFKYYLLVEDVNLKKYLKNALRFGYESDGTELIYENWADPNAIMNGACASFDYITEFKWAFRNCADEGHAICELK